MKPEARTSFIPLTTRFEGRKSWIYLDIKGLPTIGLGCLLNVQDAIRLPFEKLDGSRASSQEIEDEWRRVASHKELSVLGADAALKLCTLHLPESAIDDLALNRVVNNERVLLRDFQEWDEWPSEVQLAVMLFSWANGAGFAKQKRADGGYMWPKFTAALLARDWATAAVECKLNEAGNPGLIPRNATNRKLFEQAASHVGITNEDRQRVDRTLALFFDQELHRPHEREMDDS